MHAPCCTCGCRALFTDEFDATLSSDWNQIAGLWSTSGGFLTTSSDDAMIVHDTAQVPANKGRIVADVADLTYIPFGIIAAIDENNYAYVKFSAPAGAPDDFTVTLGYFDSGVETVLKTLSLGRDLTVTDETISLCWDGARLVGGLANMTLSGDYTAPDNLRPGFITETGTSWSFSNIALWNHIEAVRSCPTCGTCWDLCETYPETIEVYIPAGTFTDQNIAGGGIGWACTGNCANLNNQTFVLTKTADGDVGLSDFDSSTDLYTGKTGCPLYEYTEEEFCEIGDGGATTYPAALTIWLRYYAHTSPAGRFEILIIIRSDCSPGFAGGACPAAYGNRTTYLFGMDDPNSLESWSPCGPGEFSSSEADPGNFAGGDQRCRSRSNVPGFPLPSSCEFSDLACAVDLTKKLTVTL